MTVRLAIVAAMVAFDLSLHIVEFARGRRIALFPTLYVYQVFWTCYWASALVLLTFQWWHV